MIYWLRSWDVWVSLVLLVVLRPHGEPMLCHSMWCWWRPIQLWMTPDLKWFSITWQTQESFQLHWASHFLSWIKESIIERSEHLPNACVSLLPLRFPSTRQFLLHLQKGQISLPKFWAHGKTKVSMVRSSQKKKNLHLGCSWYMRS